MQFAVITAFAEEDWHSARILLALERYGEAVAVEPGDFSATCGEAGVVVGLDDSPSVTFDAFVLARGVSSRGDLDVQFGIYRALEESGHLVVNRIGPLLDAQDKFRTSCLLRRAGVPTPRAVVAQTPQAAAAGVREFQEVVLKPVAGSLGEGVERLSIHSGGEQRAEHRVHQEGAVYLQEYVPNAGRDLRVFVVEGRAIEAVERMAPHGDFRTNIARGGIARPARLRPAVACIAERAAKALHLDYTGIDVIETPDGPQVIEVNGTPAFDMIFDATGQDMSVEIARLVARKATEWRAARSREQLVRPWESHTRWTAHETWDHQLL